MDSGAVRRLLAEDVEVDPGHKLLAPTLLRSQVLSDLHESVGRGELSAADALEQLARLHKLPIRLLGDAVLRRQAWKVALQLGWAVDL